MNGSQHTWLGNAPPKSATPEPKQPPTPVAITRAGKEVPHSATRATKRFKGLEIVEEKNVVGRGSGG